MDLQFLSDDSFDRLANVLFQNETSAQDTPAPPQQLPLAYASSVCSDQEKHLQLQGVAPLLPSHAASFAAATTAVAAPPLADGVRPRHVVTTGVLVSNALPLAAAADFLPQPQQQLPTAHGVSASAYDGNLPAYGDSQSVTSSLPSLPTQPHPSERLTSTLQRRSRESPRKGRAAAAARIVPPAHPMGNASTADSQQQLQAQPVPPAAASLTVFRATSFSMAAVTSPRKKVVVVGAAQKRSRARKKAEMEHLEALLDHHAKQLQSLSLENTALKQRMRVLGDVLELRDKHYDVLTEWEHAAAAPEPTMGPTPQRDGAPISTPQALPPSALLPPTMPHSGGMVYNPVQINQAKPVAAVDADVAAVAAMTHQRDTAPVPPAAAVAASTPSEYPFLGPDDSAFSVKPCDEGWEGERSPPAAAAAGSLGASFLHELDLPALFQDDDDAAFDLMIASLPSFPGGGPHRVVSCGASGSATHAATADAGLPAATTLPWVASEAGGGPFTAQTAQAMPAMPAAVGVTPNLPHGFATSGSGSCSEASGCTGPTAGRGVTPSGSGGTGYGLPGVQHGSLQATGPWPALAPSTSVPQAHGTAGAAGHGGTIPGGYAVQGSTAGIMPQDSSAAARAAAAQCGYAMGAEAGLCSGDDAAPVVVAVTPLAADFQTRRQQRLEMWARYRRYITQAGELLVRADGLRAGPERQALLAQASAMCDDICQSSLGFTLDMKVKDELLSVNLDTGKKLEAPPGNAFWRRVLAAMRLSKQQLSDTGVIHSKYRELMTKFESDIATAKAKQQQQLASLGGLSDVELEESLEVLAAALKRQQQARNFLGTAFWFRIVTSEQRARGHVACWPCFVDSMALALLATEGGA